MNTFQYTTMEALIRNPNSTITAEQFDRFSKALYTFKDSDDPAELMKLLYQRIASSGLEQLDYTKLFMWVMGEGD